MKILITGAAGFIGYFVSKFLLERGDDVTGIDNLNDYYDVTLKDNRLAQLKTYKNFTFQKIDIVDKEKIDHLFETLKPARVVHLAAQAGVRYSFDNPDVFSRSNVTGFANILEACRHVNIEHLVFASSSSVYGANIRSFFD
jgi:UDP-glucose 4-epimerase